MNSREWKTLSLIEIQRPPDSSGWAWVKDSDLHSACALVELWGERQPDMPPRPCRRMNNPSVIIAHISRDGFAIEEGTGRIIYTLKKDK